MAYQHRRTAAWAMLKTLFEQMTFQIGMIPESSSEQVTRNQVFMAVVLKLLAIRRVRVQD